MTASRPRSRGARSSRFEAPACAGRSLTVWRRLRCSIGAGLPLDPNVETLGATACRQHCACPPGAESLKCRQSAPLVALVRERRPLTAQAGGASSLSGIRQTSCEWIAARRDAPRHAAAPACTPRHGAPGCGAGGVQSGQLCTLVAPGHACRRVPGGARRARYRAPHCARAPAQLPGVRTRRAIASWRDDVVRAAFHATARQPLWHT